MSAPDLQFRHRGAWPLRAGCHPIPHPRVAHTARSTESKLQFQRKLDGSRRASHGHLAKLRVHLLAGRIKSGGPIHRLKLRVVKGVEKLAAELQTCGFA